VVFLPGSTLRQDEEVNRELYGKKINNRQVVESSIAPPRGAEHLMALLKRYSAYEK
jgi:lipid-binding SYLF domain-containing protein